MKEEREKKTKILLILATTFCLPRPREHTHFNWANFPDFGYFRIEWCRNLIICSAFHQHQQNFFGAHVYGGRAKQWSVFSLLQAIWSTFFKLQNRNQDQVVGFPNVWRQLCRHMHWQIFAHVYGGTSDTVKWGPPTMWSEILTVDDCGAKEFLKTHGYDRYLCESDLLHQNFPQAWHV